VTPPDSDDFSDMAAYKMRAEAAQRPDHITPGGARYEQNLLDRSLEAIRHIKSDRTWLDWESIKDAVRIITDRVLAETGAASISADAFKKAWGPAWRAHESRASNELDPRDQITRQEIHDLRVLIAHPEAVAWRAGKPPHEQRRLLHPRTVIARWQAATRRERAAAQPKPQPQPQPQPQPPGASAAKPSPDKAAGPDPAAEAEIARLKSRIASLETRLTLSRFSVEGYIMPEKQFTSLRICLSADNVAFLEAVAKDNPAHRDKVDSLIKQFTKAAVTLNEFKDVLVNKAAEEKKKRSDAFWAAARWKRDQEEAKKAAAKREKAAAKRAAAKAAKG
jgi:hypothetical protein